MDRTADIKEVRVKNPLKCSANHVLLNPLKGKQYEAKAIRPKSRAISKIKDAVCPLIRPVDLSRDQSQDGKLSLRQRATEH